MNPAVNTTGWRARLEGAKRRGLTPDDLETKDLATLAGSWETCAVGENLQILEQKGWPFIWETPYGEIPPLPDNTTVRMLGTDFWSAVSLAQWDRALSLLDQIENLPTYEEYYARA